MPPAPTGIPAGLAQLRTLELTGMGATMYDDTRYSYLALGLPTESWGTFALNGTFTTSGEFERATWDADLDETFSEKESIISLGWAGSRGRFAYGLALKSVSQDIGGAKGSGSGVDLGLWFRPHRSLSIGAAVQNAGRPDDHPDRRARRSWPAAAASAWACASSTTAC